MCSFNNVSENKPELCLKSVKEWWISFFNWYFITDISLCTYKAQKSKNKEGLECMALCHRNSAYINVTKKHNRSYSQFKFQRSAGFDVSIVHYKANCCRKCLSSTVLSLCIADCCNNLSSHCTNEFQNKGNVAWCCDMSIDVRSEKMSQYCIIVFFWFTHCLVSGLPVGKSKTKRLIRNVSLIDVSGDSTMSWFIIGAGKLRG